MNRKKYQPFWAVYVGHQEEPNELKHFYIALPLDKSRRPLVIVHIFGKIVNLFKSVRSRDYISTNEAYTVYDLLMGLPDTDDPPYTDASFQLEAVVGDLYEQHVVRVEFMDPNREVMK